MTNTEHNGAPLTDEILMAYADNALSPQDAAAVERAVTADPALLARVERFRDTARFAAQSYASILNEPAPDRLIAAARGQTGQSRFFAGSWARAGMAGAALAASFALGVLVAPRDMPRNEEFLARGALASALSIQPSGQTQDGIRVAMTIPSDTGYCRAFATQEIEGLACQDGDAWRLVSFSQATQKETSSQYRTAAGGVSPATLMAIDEYRTGDPLGAEDETAAIARGFAKR